MQTESTSWSACGLITWPSAVINAEFDNGDTEWPARGTAATPGARSVNGSTPAPASPAVCIPAPETAIYMYYQLHNITTEWNVELKNTSINC